MSNIKIKNNNHLLLSQFDDNYNIIFAKIF